MIRKLTKGPLGQVKTEAGESQITTADSRREKIRHET